MRVKFLTLFFFFLCINNAISNERISLFNGRDLSGWTVKCAAADREKQFWSVQDAAIEANSIGQPDHDYVWLVTNEEFNNFVLTLKFQAFSSSPGNSGIQIRSRYDDAAEWLDGPQIDINPPAPWRTGMIWDETRENKRWLYPQIPATAWIDSSMAVENIIFYYSEDVPVWNEIKVVAQGTHLLAELNRVVVMEWDGAGVLDDAVHQKYGVGIAGHIALQIHVNDELKIRFKDIYLRKMD